MTIRLAVFIQYRKVTDGRTDRLAISISRVSVSLTAEEVAKDKPKFGQKSFKHILLNVRCMPYPVMCTRQSLFQILERLSKRLTLNCQILNISPHVLS